MVEAVALSSGTPEQLWAILADVTRWPQLLPTFTSIVSTDVEQPEGGHGAGGDLRPALRVGARFHVRQPGLPAATYEVIDCAPGVSFTWVARTRGLTTTASHTVSSVESGARIDLQVHWSGVLAGPVRWSMTRRTARMIALEATTFARVAGSSGQP